MYRRIVTYLAALLLGASLQAGATDQENASPSLTIYNHGFAVVRQKLELDLRAGLNRIRFAGATLHLEPDSVILRDLTGGRSLQILEQNYRNDPVSQALLLSLYEGKVIDFEVHHQDHTEIVKGKIIRSGYLPHGGGQEPIIEIDGRLQFYLPGQPLFPALGDDTILKPTLNWLLRTDKPGISTGGISYVTGGMSWEAAYNLVVNQRPGKDNFAADAGEKVELVGWVTMNNETGQDFDEARIKLMAGDVNKLRPVPPREYAYKARAMAMDAASSAGVVVTEKTFDEFHLYTLEHPATLHDHETKQVEFVSAGNVSAQRVYVYEGFDKELYPYYGGDANQDPNYGSQANTKIWVMQQFKNSKENSLGIPLPKGRVRFYRRDEDGQLEFTGENEIDHTPTDETIRLYTGNAFDITGDRRRVEIHVDTRNRSIDESFEITLHNHKKQPVQVQVVERLYRWVNWKIVDETSAFHKRDAQTVEFPVNVATNGQQTLRYTVHYSW